LPPDRIADLLTALRMVLKRTIQRIARLLSEVSAARDEYDEEALDDAIGVVNE